MSIISITYTLIWQFKNAEHYQVTRCRKVFNMKTGRLILPRENGGSIGYWIKFNKRKFIVLDKLNSHLEKITKDILPF